MKNIEMATTDVWRLRVYMVTMWKRADMKKVDRIWTGRGRFENGLDQKRRGSYNQPRSTREGLDQSHSEQLSVSCKHRNI